MELTQTEKDIIRLLKALKMGGEEVVGVSFVMSKTKKSEEMLDWLLSRKNDPPTEEEVLEKALELSGPSD